MRKILLFTTVATICFLITTSSIQSEVDSPRSPILSRCRQVQAQLTLPKPTGPYEIGTIALHLIDHYRQDPYTATTHPRELMVSIWYPALPENRCAPRTVAPWMPVAALDYFRADLGDLLATLPLSLPPPGPPSNQPPPAGLPSPETSSEPMSLVQAVFPHTHARNGAAVERSRHRFPIVLYSPGFAFDREAGTALVEDLTSHGYMVVTVSHTYDSSEVQFPGGRVELGKGMDGPNNPATPYVGVSIRLADIQFVIDCLTQLASGCDALPNQQKLPFGLAAALDLTRIGMFGHSVGGCTTASVMAIDPRILAGVDLDGTIFPTVPINAPGDAAEAEESIARIARGIGLRPFLVMASDLPNGPTSSPAAIGPRFWENLIGWKRFIKIKGSTHYSFTDLSDFIAQLGQAGLIPQVDLENLPPLIGTIEPRRAIELQRVYVRAFFDRALRGQPNPLLDGPSPQYPEAFFGD